MAMCDSGITPPKDIVNDGQIHRFSSNGKSGDKSGYYAFFSHPNGLNAGFFGCWRSGVYSTWSSRHKSTFTAQEKALLDDFNLKAKHARQEVHQDRAKYANELWAKAEPASCSHSYLATKQLTQVTGIAYMSKIPCSGFFMDETRTTSLRDALLIPVYDENNSIQSLQAITADGKKFFMKGGQTKGGRLTIEGSNETVYVCEGYATGASIHDLTQSTVIVCFNASNLKSVAPTLQAAFPGSTLIVAADNDHQKEKEGKGNKGLEVAQNLLDYHRIPYTSPQFEEGDNGTDWNDFCQNKSPEDVVQALEDNLIEPPVIFDSFEDCLKALRENQDDEHAFNCAIVMIKNAPRLKQTRMRKQLKETSQVDMGDIRKAIGDLFRSEEKPELTHSQIAEKYIEAQGQPKPVGVYGKLWVYNAVNGIWEEQALSQTGVIIAEKYAHEGTCRRGSDYRAIASHVYDIVANEEFFENVPPGLHTPKGFIYADGAQLKMSPPCAEHRARFRLNIEPDFNQQPTKLLAVLNEAFAGCYPIEQIRQLQMLTGMTLLGLLPPEQRAVLLHGAAGSGKSLYLRLLESLIPSQFRTSVSPLDLDSDYKIAALAGKLINLVPEIDKDKSVPSAQFKAITGGDTVSAREPYGKVFSYTPNTACWFNGNFYPTTKDHTEGFWRRWSIINFVNTKPAHQRNPKLFDEIVAEEMPAFLGWAMNGALDYLENGLYLSPAHDQCIAEWRRDGNSVTSWLHSKEDNDVAPRKSGYGKHPLKRTHAYQIYREWCRHNNRQPFNNQTFYSHMEGAGYTTTTYNGYTCYEALFDARSTPKNWGSVAV